MPVAFKLMIEKLGNKQHIKAPLTSTMTSKRPIIPVQPHDVHARLSLHMKILQTEKQTFFFPILSLQHHELSFFSNFQQMVVTLPLNVVPWWIGLRCQHVFHKNILATHEVTECITTALMEDK